MTNRGRLIFGALAGVLVWLICSFGGYPDGVACCCPVGEYHGSSDRLLHAPRVYGHRSDKTMLKTIRKHGITLALAAGSTGLTAVINQMTKINHPRTSAATTTCPVRSGIAARSLQ